MNSSSTDFISGLFWLSTVFLGLFMYSIWRIISLFNTGYHSTVYIVFVDKCICWQPFRLLYLWILWTMLWTMAHRTVSQARKLTPIIWRLKQNDDRFQARLDYTESSKPTWSIHWYTETLLKKKKKRFVWVLLFLCSV